MPIQLPKLKDGQKIYFASDFHLGAPNHQESRQREQQIIKWLDQISSDAAALFLVGDIFDFWFEYKHVIPKGFIRLQGKLAALADQGIPIYLFVGNHDMWMFDYFKEELNLDIHYDSQEFDINGKSFLVGHGDGLGPNDRFYKFIKRIFRNKGCQWLFGRLHPNLGMWIAQTWSNKSRKSHGVQDEKFHGDGEHLTAYCRSVSKTKSYDYFIFGHRHLPIKVPINDSCTYFNLGEWINYQTYGVFDGDNMELRAFEKDLVVFGD